jgi:amino acid transporter
MARDRVIGETMGRLHPRFQTPWLAGFAVGGVTLFLFAASAAFPSVGALMTSLINAIGVQVACYYALAGFACAWHFRKAVRRGGQNRLNAVLIPLLSAIFVAGVGIYQLPFLGWHVASLSIGTILIGIVPYYFYRWRYRGFYPPKNDWA